MAGNADTVVFFAVSRLPFIWEGFPLDCTHIRTNTLMIMYDVQLKHLVRCLGLVSMYFITNGHHFHPCSHFLCYLLDGGNPSTP